MRDLETLKACPVEITLDLISKKWVVQIIKDMFFGKSNFNEFKMNKPELTNKSLSRCLKQMEEDGLIIKTTNPANIRDTEYKLTPKGYSMNRIIYELAAFTVDNDGCVENLDEDGKYEVKLLFRENLNLNDDV